MYTYGWGPPGYLEEIFGRLTYAHFYGLSLNREHAHAMDGAILLRAIRAAFSAKPDPMLVDAASDTSGIDTAAKVSRQSLEATADEAATRWLRHFGGAS